MENKDLFGLSESAYNSIEKTDHMQYLPDMEIIDSDMLQRVLELVDKYCSKKYTKADVEKALAKRNRTVEDFAALLSGAAADMLEDMAFHAKQERRRYFGNSVNIFTPIYLANYCENYCVYCGFNSHNKIKRAKLSMEQMEEEMKSIADSGIQEVLLLTGESRAMSDVEYIGKACQMAQKYFKVVGIEIYPVNTDEYRYLHNCGADYVTVFQETYNSDRYEHLHLEGYKRIFPYRFYSQERAVLGGMRGVGFAALLGLDDFRKDALATGLHAYLLQRKYPHAEISLSCPRLRPIINNDKLNAVDVHEKELVQIVLAYRLFLPFASIVVSSRECAEMRDNLMVLAANKISAGVSTGVGCHTTQKDAGDDQFEIADSRSLTEIYHALEENNLQPVMAEYVYV